VMIQNVSCQLFQMVALPDSESADEFASCSSYDDND